MLDNIHVTVENANYHIDEEALVPVQREWTGWRVAHARLRDLENVHWFQPVGAPRHLLHAYVSPQKLVSGDVLEASEQGCPPERLLVCVLKSHAAPSTYLALASRAEASKASSFAGKHETAQ